MRVTADLINNSLSYINPLKERELDLRGNKIPAIENLGAAKDQECLDFTDNDITILGNFPLSPKVTTLLLSRNRINAIQPSIVKATPGLTTLVLAQNRISELGALQPLGGLKKLKHLVLVDNPVTRDNTYRPFVIALIPSLHYLDYQHIKKAERDNAAALYGTPDEPAEAFLAIKSAARSDNLAIHVNGTSADGPTAAERMKLSDRETNKIKELIGSAKSLNEITRLERALEEGRIPPDILKRMQEDEEMEE